MLTKTNKKGIDIQNWKKKKEEENIESYKERLPIFSTANIHKIANLTLMLLL